MSKDWHLYILRCANGDLYTGITTDVDNRFEQHQQGKGAKRTKGRGPLSLEFQTCVGEKGPALQLEHRIKQLTREQKEDLINGNTAIECLITGND